MTATNYVANKHNSLAITIKTFTIVMEQRTFKNVNNVQIPTFTLTWRHLVVKVLFYI
jgi:hypothetical protein